MLNIPLSPPPPENQLNEPQNIYNEWGKYF